MGIVKDFALINKNMIAVFKMKKKPIQNFKKVVQFV